MSLTNTWNFTIFTRLNAFGQSIQKGDTEIRTVLFAEAWNQFLNNPIAGDRWVTKKESFYPHNIFIEVLMSMGIIGFSIFLMINIEIIKKIILIIRRKDIDILPLSMVLIANFLAAMTSGSIAFSTELWVLITLFLSVSFNYRIRLIKRQRPTVLIEKRYKKNE